MTTETTSLDALDQYLQEIRNIPRVTLDEELRCFSAIERAKREQNASAEANRARKRLVEAFQCLVIKIAKYYWVLDSTLGLLDLIQEGNVGLIDAIERHHVQCGTRFGALARVCIRSAIRDACGASDGRGLPVYKARILNYLRVLQTVEQPEHMQADKYVREQRYMHEVQGLAMEKAVSLERLQERFEDTLSPTHDLYGVHAAEHRRLVAMEQRIQQAIEALPEDQRQVIQLRYNFTPPLPAVGYDKREQPKPVGAKRTAVVPQQEVATTVGKSLGWVQMRELRALQALRNVLAPILLDIVA